ncbi:MAG: hypothetical protein IKN75_07890 [Prevotella sp.]|nr:hypothetical protein [Prevotella sp.]
MKTISRYIMTLALLITAATGAWAQTETLLTTITATGQTTYSESTAGVVTVSHDNDYFDNTFGWLWYEHAGSVTVEAKDGYTITRCVFRQPYKTPFTVSTAPFKVDFIETSDPEMPELKQYLCQGYMDGVSSIEVYGFAPPAGPEVTINEAKSEASFKMPQYDVTATYTLKRDMTVDVSAELASRIRIRKSGPAYVAVNETEWLPVVTDKLDGDNPVEMINYTDYNRELEKQGTTADEWSYASTLSVGTFRWKITGKGNYTGTIYSNEFQLYEGYEVEVPAGEYVTYYKDEALKVEDADAKLYTITAVDETAATATLSDAMTVTPANTPLLVYNSSEDTKNFLLIPTTDEADNVTAADEFKGTLEATQIAASTTTQNNYAFNGKAFVWVKNDIAIAANKAWLEIGSGAAGARSVVLVFSDSLTGVNLTPALSEGEGAWYDLSGRKLQGKPTKSGVYINNGKKVTIK